DGAKPANAMSAIKPAMLEKNARSFKAFTGRPATNFEPVAGTTEALLILGSPIFCVQLCSSASGRWFLAQVSCASEKVRCLAVEVNRPSPKFTAPVYRARYIFIAVYTYLCMRVAVSERAGHRWDLCRYSAVDISTRNT